MKKLLMLGLLIPLSFLMSGCSYSDEEAIETFGGQYVFDTVSELSVEDTDGDGVYSEEEYQESYDYIIEMYEEDYFVSLSQDTVNDMTFCIDLDMSNDHIYSAMYAIQLYNKIEGINIDFVLDTDCYLSGYAYYITSMTSDELIEMYQTEEYGYSLEDAILEVDTFWAVNWTTYYESDGYIITSEIFIQSTFMDELTLDEKTEIIIHEIGHTFGLNDMYDEDLESISIMWYTTTEYDPMLELSEYDIYNLEWMYCPDFEEDAE